MHSLLFFQAITQCPLRSAHFPQAKMNDLMKRCHFPSGSQNPLEVICIVSIRHIPGSLPPAGGAGGGNERIMKMTLLHDPRAEKTLLHMNNTDIVFNLNEEKTLGDVLAFFMRNKPLNAAAKAPLLLASLKDINTRYHGEIDVRAY